MLYQLVTERYSHNYFTSVKSSFYAYSVARDFEDSNRCTGHSMSVYPRLKLLLLTPPEEPHGQLIPSMYAYSFFLECLYDTVYIK